MTQPIAYRTPLPCTVPPGGLAVILADGRVAPDGVQGPGDLDPKAWRKAGRRLEAVLFPAADLRLRFDLTDLRSAEGVGLDLTVTLALRIERPVRFLTDLLHDAPDLSRAELTDRLSAALRTGLARDLAHRPLSDLEADDRLRARLETAIEHYLTVEADLPGRSGLAVLGVEAFDLRCQVLDEERRVRESYYLRATLAGAEAAGRRLLDERVLAELRAHLPAKEDLVAHKEQLAILVEREAQADARLGIARRARRDQLRAWLAAYRRAPSELRPEIWRRDLQASVRTAPLAHGGRVYIAARQGRILALDAESGEETWPQAVELGVAPGDGLAWAEGRVWVPGHDGILYALDAESGAVVHRLEIGGRLSSAPLLHGDRLYLSVDVDAANLRPGYGDVVAVDPRRGRIAGRWTVSRRGLRAQPAIRGRTLYIGDRGGGFYALDLRRGRVETWSLPRGGGRILAPALVDEARGQVLSADSYGRLLALDLAGRARWSIRLGGPVVGRPLLYGGRLYVGAGDGQLHRLDPATGQPDGKPFTTREAIAAPPVGWRDLLFVSANDGYLYALETDALRVFWQYHSGRPISLPPAVTPEGRLYVVDGDGRLSALRWCLARYAEAARRVEAAEAVELWLLAGETQAALEAAVQAGRLDLEAELAAHLHRYGYAAQRYEALARRSRNPLTAARWWAEAADLWQQEGRAEEAERCRRRDARNRRAPLLRLEAVNLPPLQAGRPDEVQIGVTNQTDFWAQEVRLAYEGQVRRAGELDLGSLGPHSHRIEAIEVLPTESGSATLRVTARYADEQGHPQRPVHLAVRLRVERPPEVHQHFYGPHVGGDGVIILRGGAGGGRRIQVQSGEDALEIGPAGGRTCPACGAPVAAEHHYCARCGNVVS